MVSTATIVARGIFDQGTARICAPIRVAQILTESARTEAMVHNRGQTDIIAHMAQIATTAVSAKISRKLSLFLWTLT